MNSFRISIINSFFLCISLLISENGNSQLVQDTGSVFYEVSSIISGMPGDTGNDFKLPTTAELISWGNVLDNLLLGNYDKASDTAKTIGYDLVKFADTTNGVTTIYYILKTNSTNFWGTYVYNPNYCRSLVIQSPHSIKDFNTGKEGIHVFMQTESLFFCLNGTNRCNQSTYSACSGSTSICSGSPESYRISDLPHTISTIYQSTTDTLLRRFNESYFLQLHGFSKKATDPYIILSNGTQVTPSPDYIAPFKTNLEAEDPLFVDNIKVAHLNLNWTRLRGFSNVQGRLINSSADHCNSDAIITNGRFIHMEQEKTRLRDNKEGWNKVVNALINTFSCNSTAIPEDNLHKPEHPYVRIYPNPTNDQITVEGSKIELEQIDIYNIHGQNVTNQIRKIYFGEEKCVFSLSKLSTGLYFIKTKTTSHKIYKQ